MDLDVGLFPQLRAPVRRSRAPPWSDSKAFWKSRYDDARFVRRRLRFSLFSFSTCTWLGSALTLKAAPGATLTGCAARGRRGLRGARAARARTSCKGLASMSLRDLSLVMDSDHASKKIWSALRCGISPFSLNLSQGQAGALRALDPDQQLEKLLREDAVESLGKSESIEENGNSEFSEAPRTQKYLLRLHDGLAVESVLIPLQSRSPAKTATTACISSQVGCAQGCRFCRTGDMGLLRNLSSEEILAQVVQGRRIARDLGLPEVRKVVFMGMGDPLANIPSVRTAVGALSDGLRMAIGRKRLQVSTIAPSPAKVMQVAGMRCGVVWSLHAANDALRSQLVPTAKHSILELRDAFMQLVKSGGGVTPDRRLLVAVVMIAGVNDDERHASELADFLLTDVRRS